MSKAVFALCIVTELVLVFQFIYKYFDIIITWICKAQICVFVT